MPTSHKHRNLVSRTRAGALAAAAALVVAAALVGCGGSDTVTNAEPLTEEQKAAIKSEDLMIESEEKGTPTPAPSKKR